jgi:hypothetical protein
MREIKNEKLSAPEAMERCCDFEEVQSNETECKAKYVDGAWVMDVGFTWSRDQTYKVVDVVHSWVEVDALTALKEYMDGKEVLSQNGRITYQRDKNAFGYEWANGALHKVWRPLK